MSTEDIVRRAGAIFARHPEVHLALLFGSHARGQAGPRSDIDLAVAGSDVDQLRLAGELSLGLGAEVDVVDLADVGYSLLKAIHRDGVVVHRRDAAAEASWRLRVLLTIETDGPLLDRMRDAYLERMAGR